jgi:glycosyltransferase involved in cell wall biosynthesis
MLKFKKRTSNNFKSKLLNLNNIITQVNNIEKPSVIKHSNPLLYNNNKHDKYFWEFDIEPSVWVSVLIPCHNTKREFIEECLKSLKEQIGNFGIELVWINDCSNEENTNIQLELLKELECLKNFKLIYNRTRINRGISFCLHQGVLTCSNELILRMDSDDIMINNRIQSQINYMINNPSCVLCGSNVISFEIINGIKSEIGRTRHKNILTWNEYRLDPKDWFLNHPTLCFKKSAILRAGNYRKNFRVPFEDLELELRVLKMFGSVHNIEECLVLYRSHENQISIKLGGNDLNKQLKMTLIREIIKN